jgi:hypothetical protein
MAPPIECPIRANLPDGNSLSLAKRTIAHRLRSVFPFGGRFSMTRKVQSIDAMLPFEIIRLKVPDRGISRCTMDEKERGLFFRPLLLRDNHMNPGSF